MLSTSLTHLKHDLYEATNETHASREDEEKWRDEFHQVVRHDLEFVEEFWALMHVVGHGIRHWLRLGGTTQSTSSKTLMKKVQTKQNKAIKSSPQQELLHTYNYTPQGTKLSTCKPHWENQCQQICSQTKKQQDTTNIQQFIYWKQRNTYT